MNSSGRIHLQILFLMFVLFSFFSGMPQLMNTLSVEWGVWRTNKQGKKKQNSSDQKKIDGKVKMSAMTAYQIIIV